MYHALPKGVIVPSHPASFVRPETVDEGDGGKFAGNDSMENWFSGSGGDGGGGGGGAG